MRDENNRNSGNQAIYTCGFLFDSERFRVSGVIAAGSRFGLSSKGIAVGLPRRDTSNDLGGRRK